MALGGVGIKGMELRPINITGFQFAHLFLQQHPLVPAFIAAKCSLTPATQHHATRFKIFLGLLTPFQPQG